MSSKLSEIESRIASARQLETVIGAMRGVMLAQERALRYGWCIAMASLAEDVMRVAGQVADAVFARFRDRQDAITAEIAELAATGAWASPAAPVEGQS